MARSDSMRNARIPRYCVLEYVAPSRDASPGRIVLIMTNGPGGFQILVTPRLHEIVEKPDLGYIESLFEDLLYRIDNGSDALFEQLASLSVGRLICSSVGTTQESVPELIAIARTFRPLKAGR